MTSVTLSSPVEHNGVTYSVLNFREATVGDLVIAGSFKDEIAQSVAVLAAISDVPLSAFKKIKASDFNAIIAVTADALGNGSTTGS